MGHVFLSAMSEYKKKNQGFLKGVKVKCVPCLKIQPKRLSVWGMEEVLPISKKTHKRIPSILCELPFSVWGIPFLDKGCEMGVFVCDHKIGSAGLNHTYWRDLG